MEEQWIKWEPIVGLSEKYYIESVLDTIEEGFKILLSDAKDRQKKVRIIFYDSVDAYQSTNETYAYRVIDNLHNKYGKNFYGKWTFFKVESSAYMQRISEQSYGISDERSLVHFSFIAVDSIVDVITNYEPKIEFIP